MASKIEIPSFYKIVDLLIKLVNSRYMNKRYKHNIDGISVMTDGELIYI